MVAAVPAPDGTERRGEDLSASAPPSPNARQAAQQATCRRSTPVHVAPARVDAAAEPVLCVVEGDAFDRTFQVGRVRCDRSTRHREEDSPEAQGQVVSAQTRLTRSSAS